MQELSDRILPEGQPSEASGLADADQRSLLRLIFVVTALTMVFFCMLQALEGHYLLAAFELAASCALFWAAWQVSGARNVVRWVYIYLIPLFGFLIYIVSMPDASATAFVWIYLVPILSYLLLGRKAGFVLAAPVMTLTALAYMLRFGVPETPVGWIDLGNALLCGLLVLVFVHLYEGRRAAAQRALQSMAETDALTGVANRGHFQAHLDRSVRESTRTHAPFVLVVLDVDLFKEVNDRWGHDAGDAALRHICDCLAERLRATDFIGRLGGEEFGIVLGNTDTDAAIHLVEDLRNRIASNRLEHERHSITLSATFGLAEWPVDGNSPGALYRSADRRLYRGKAKGRNLLIARDEI
ncbi:GGDEF domain-containing protein [Halopseudomonas sp.]|uniref:GGDEF domain-containing protein n=1 Tax=Halopseudomonas sp. TaxID=2901191 RepID=UPI003563D445